MIHLIDKKARKELNLAFKYKKTDKALSRYHAIRAQAYFELINECKEANASD